MKNCFLIFVFYFSVVFGTTAQEKYATYRNSYVDKDYDISVSFNDPKFSIYIDGMPFDRIRDSGGFSVDEKSYPGFIRDLKAAREKYSEWIEVAKANNVTVLDKSVELKPQVVTGYFMGGSKFYFDFSVRPEFDFKILDKESGLKYLMIVRSGKMAASSNEYIDTDGFGLVFTSVAEMDEFIELIGTEKLTEFKNISKNKDTLFKN
jgi:hypothetical protein